uniref:Cyclic nucleotide-binding domain-containing protein n=1 Tax=Chromera velia CCMP2878 TaxID=1169474 RepID=A0A0G4G8H7_9ALVE|eukprot:Cvel_20752.t1-p1 / transcript=Cvel_20752.t1 / gene=Cvel_20752 / organism=Chromera_velia_CCMP2878 / gene_product=Cyclic nucleotide-gated cation channel beta-3, putative / transcript_product=Cyclic nucleotide-gated cation channel beta-3, putative / location=Cvel_scaffold1891:6901-17006(-) / protein_length=1049 / sequence_SO=supercontig / SO=protein_coding / is_pseudo=false
MTYAEMSASKRQMDNAAAQAVAEWDKKNQKSTVNSQRTIPGSPSASPGRSRTRQKSVVRRQKSVQTPKLLDGPVCRRFLLDIIVVFPFAWVFIASRSESTLRGRLSGVYVVLCLFRLFVVKRAVEVYRFVLSQFQVNLNLMRLLSILLSVLGFVHLVACLFIRFGLDTDSRSKGVEESWMKRIPVPLEGEVRTGTEEPLSDGTVYLHAVYFAMNSFAKLGLGDVGPVSLEERLFVSGVFAVCYFFSAAVFGNVAALVTDQIRQFVQALRQYFSYVKLTSQGTDESKLFEALPDCLRVDILQFAYSKIVFGAPMFRMEGDMTKDIMWPVVNSVFRTFNVHIFITDDVIARESDPAEEIFFLIDGEVGILQRNAFKNLLKAFPELSFHVDKVISAFMEEYTRAQEANPDAPRTGSMCIAAVQRRVTKLRQSLRPLAQAESTRKSMMATARISKGGSPLIQMSPKSKAAAEEAIKESEAAAAMGPSSRPHTGGGELKDIRNLQSREGRGGSGTASAAGVRGPRGTATTGSRGTSIFSRAGSSLESHRYRISAEEEESRGTGFRRVVMPDSILVTMSVCTHLFSGLVAVWLVPLVFSFNPSFLTPTAPASIAINGLLDLEFLFFFLVSLKTAFSRFQDQELNWIFCPKEVALHYLTTQGGWLDALCALPLLWLIPIDPFSAWSWLRFIRALVVVRLHTFWKGVSEVLDLRIQVTGGLTVCCAFVLVWHGFSAAWYLTGRMERESGVFSWLDELPETVDVSGPLSNQDFALTFVYSYYYVLSIVSTFEAVRTKVMLDGASSALRRQTDFFSSFMWTRHSDRAHAVVDIAFNELRKVVPPLLYRRFLLSFYRYCTCLPAFLAAGMGVRECVSDCREFLEQVPIFREQPEGFMLQLVAFVRTQIYMPGDIVCRKNDPGNDMYIILEGRCNVMSSDENSVLVTLEAGDYFGEIALIAAERQFRVCSVYADSFCALLSLRRVHLQKILKHSPTVAEAIRQVASERMGALGKAAQRLNGPRPISSEVHNMYTRSPTLDALHRAKARSVAAVYSTQDDTV